MAYRFLAFLLLITGGLCAQELPEDFYDITYLTELDNPMGMTFDENGRMYVWEKKGVVRVVDTAGNLYPEPLIDISEEVSNWKDHGLMGFTLDNDFLANGYFYLLYALDLHHYEYYGTPEYSPDSTVTWKPTIGRVVRYRADPTTAYLRVLEGSRHILLGETIEDGIPLMYEFHGLGDLVMGQDGTLLISAGDGTSNGGPDTGGDEYGTMASEAIATGIITEDEDLGSYRAQYLANYNGKIMRIDPETGDGLSSNPFFQLDAPRSPQSRIWAYGFRNPYRIQVRPNTGSHYSEDGDPGTLYIGDVGNGAWEELDIAPEGGLNFGWPMMEGFGSHWPYINEPAPANQLHPNPLYGNGGCDQPFLNFKDLYVNPREDGHRVPSNPCDDSVPIEGYTVGTMPTLQWSNARWNPPTRAQVASFDDNGWYKGLNVDAPESSLEDTELFDGFSSLAGVFYEGDQYPDEYHGKYFMVDFSGWIKVADFDDADQLHSVKPFHSNAKDIIHLALNPADGKLYYISLEGTVHQISYGGNPPPVAKIQAEQFFGPGPLTVEFDGSASYDSNLPIVRYEWDFGDGTTAEGQNVEHTYTGTGQQRYTAVLTVYDSLGASATDEAVVALNNTPPQVNIISFQDGDRYPLDQSTTLLRLEAEVTDAEHADEELMYEWRTFLHHNDHFHPDPVDFEHLSFALISPLGCQEELYWYRIQLTVTDPGGLKTSVTQRVYPYCGDPFLEWNELAGAAAEGGVNLTWDTQLEDSLAYFEVQRSPDAYKFTALGQVAAKGNGQYTFFDDGPRRGTNIYRVKAVTENGAYRYSNPLRIGYPEPLAINVFPNPARDAFTLELLEAQAGQVRLELLDETGRVVLEKSWETDTGEPFSERILPGQLPNGAYFYRVTNGAQRHYGQLILLR
ncbi:PQQ-dependent sugar dehydrogenase [Phaeodactylibacter xiamenensis]|uniref:PQQ-dependent sugar dehydrogenase n=1 Tax=Phaeodactylibacter xiamenensis TaxID=1524460 RepID=UPI0024A963B1|nr:PQQ-dependent sugar dehydrogenase [Phaeodactylibacter xiamenensis]